MRKMRAACGESGSGQLPRNPGPAGEITSPGEATTDQASIMNLSTYREMDPHLLVGLINTELRNHCESLDDLTKTHGLDEALLIAKLADAGYQYREDVNQFR